MDTARVNRLVATMAAMAEGDRAAIFSLYGEFRRELIGFMRGELRRMGVDTPRPDELDGLVIDACLALFDCAGGWKPEGGALPWTWASRRLAGLASGFVGQHAGKLPESVTEGSAGGDRSARPVAAEDEPELDVLVRLAATHAGCALVLEALERVASPRDQAILLELRSQQSAGDPSPAVTVAGRYNVSVDVVRQAACRVRSRLCRLAVEDRRFAGLADLPIVA